jgi:hypothetical protein
VVLPSFLGLPLKPITFIFILLSITGPVSLPD